MNQRLWLIVLALVFAASHLPLMYRTGGGQDEDWYAIPGTTILRSGIPRVPYIPARDPTSGCYKIDVALYMLPPLSYYLQALTQLFLGDGVGPARVPSLLAGLAAMVLVYDLSRIWFGDRRGALLAALAFIASRAFLFPATTARPDMIAAAFGLLALWFVVRYRRDPRDQTLVFAGLAAGSSLLTHPFGVVPAVQVGLAVLATPGSLRSRLRGATIYTATALAVFALWLPLIALHPDLFRIQFGGNVLSVAGPGLGRSALAPWLTLGHQARQFWNFVGPIQVGAYVLGLLWAVNRGVPLALPVPRDSSLAEPVAPGEGREFLAHLVGSALLLAVFEGRHPTLGYYVYPVALASIALGMLASDLAGLLESRGAWVGGITTALAACLLLAVFLPGAGLRVIRAHAIHANDPNYDAHALARAIMADTPKSALIAVDGAYVIDFYLAGRPVVDATITAITYDVRDQPFEYAVLGSRGIKLYKHLMTDLVLIRTYGDKTDPFSEYAELYRRDTSHSSP